MIKTSEAHDVGRFDDWSHSYEQSRYQRILFDRVHQAVLQCIAENGSPASILDVGCGTGRLLRAAQQRWPEAQLSGVDASEGMVKVAQQYLSNVTLSVGKAEALPVPDASVDVALSTISFHHWSDQAAGLREIARVLRPGGHFLLADFAVPDALSWFPRVSRIHYPAYLRKLFIQSGFEVVKQQPVWAHLVWITVGQIASDHTIDEL